MSEARDSEARGGQTGSVIASEDEGRTLVSASGMTPAVTSTTSPDYRDDLGSRRWNAAPLRNPEVDKTDPRIAVAAILILAAITLIVLVAGYATGFWQLPGDETAASGLVSAAVAALELLA